MKVFILCNNDSLVFAYDNKEEAETEAKIRNGLRENEFTSFWHVHDVEWKRNDDGTCMQNLQIEERRGNWEDEFAKEVLEERKMTENPIQWKDPEYSGTKAVQIKTRYVCVKSPWFHKLYPGGTTVIGNNDIEPGWELATISRQSSDCFWGMFVEGLGLFNCMFPKENVRELTEVEKKAWSGKRLGIYGSHSGKLSYCFNLPSNL